MRIQYIEIDGFKNIDNAHIDLKGITALMALNSKGKSNLLKGILYGLLLLQSPTDTRNYIYSSYNPLSRPLTECSKDKAYSFSLCATTALDEEEVTLFYSFSASWGEKSLVISHEELKIKPSDSQRPTTFYKREGLRAEYKSSKARAADNEIEILNAAEMLPNLLLGRKLYYESLIKSLCSILYAIDRHFDNASSFQSVAFSPIDEDFSFYWQKIENTPENMFLLKKNYRQYYSRIQSALTILFPDVLEVDVKKIDGGRNVIGVQNYYLLYARVKNIPSPINCSELSDGFKRILNSLIFLSICEIKGMSLVALEEPENSINPTVLGKYLQVIGEFADSFDILITSHSPFLLQYIDLGKVYIGLDNEAGNISFKRIKSTYIRRVTERSEKLDLSTGTYIFDVLSDEERFNKEILKDALE